MPAYAAFAIATHAFARTAEDQGMAEYQAIESPADSKVRMLPTQLHSASQAGTDDALNLAARGLRVLQVNSAASRETLARAASRLADIAPDAGYSQAALHSRAVVLKAAVDFSVRYSSAPGVRQMPRRGQAPGATPAT